MSLSLSAKWTENTYIKENWLFQLYNQDSYLNIDGTDDYIDLGTTTASSPLSIQGSSESGHDGITIAFWINFPDVGASEIIFASNSTATYSGYFIQKNASNQIVFHWGNDGGTGTSNRRSMTGDTTLSANTWYFVVITSTFALATSGTKIYINSADTSDSITASGSSSGSFPTTPTYVSDGKGYIGREDFASTDYGGRLYLKNLAIWNVRLDATNTDPIGAIYNSGSFLSLAEDSGNYTQASDLKGYWEFNNGNNKAIDLTDNTSPATITGAKYGGFLGLSFYDTTVESIDYFGAILNKPSIRESINLENSTAKTSNVSLSLANFRYLDDDLSAELFGGSRNYINRPVKVYIQPNDDVDMGDCLQIYNGRLTDVSHNASKMSLRISAVMPWDNISIPSDKTTDNGIYVPISYGNFTENSASTFASPQFESALTSKAYRPVPFNKMNDKSALYVDGVSTSSSGELAVYEKGLDIFVPLENAVANNGSSVDGTFHDKSDLLQIRAFQQRADSITQVSNSNVTVANESRAIDTDNTNYASYSVSFVQEDNSGSRVVDLSLGTVSGKSDKHFITLRDADGDVVLLNDDSGSLDTSETGVTIDDDENIRAYDVVKIDDEEMAVTAVSSDTLTVRRGFGSKKETHDNDEVVYYDQTINAVAIKYEVVFTTSVGNNTIKIEAKTDGDNLLSTFTSNESATTLIRNITNGTDSIRLKVHFQSSESNPSIPATLIAEVRIYDVYLLTQRISEVPEDMLYVANDGLTDNGWNSSSAITEIHEAHRDLLHRHTSYTKANTPTNYSSGTNLDGSKDWDIRYWLLEQGIY